MKSTPSLGCVVLPFAARWRSIRRRASYSTPIEVMAPIYELIAYFLWSANDALPTKKPKVQIEIH